MNRERLKKLNSFLKEIKNVDINSKTIKSFRIEDFEEDQKKIRNRKNDKNK